MRHNKKLYDDRSAAHHPLSKNRVYTSEQLFGTERQIRLLHNGDEYRLSLTRAGKLILTK